MGVLRKALLVGALLGAGAGVGSALFALVTPGEQQKHTMLKVGATGENPRWGARAASPGFGAGTANLPLARRRCRNRTRGAGRRRP